MTTPQTTTTTATSPSPPAIPPDSAHLYDEDGFFYPEPDGEPMPDPEYQDRNIRSARYQLDGFYHHRPGAYVSGNTVIYYQRGNPRRNVSPDCYVAFNVDYSRIAYRDSFWVWELGKPPDFVLEVASQSTASVDIGPKMAIYAEMGVMEYWLFDRTTDGEHYGFRLAGFRLVNGRYEPIPLVEDAPDRLGGYSPTLGLDIRWEYDATLEYGIIRFYNPLTGEYLLDYDSSFGALEDARAARDNAQAERNEARDQARESRDKAREARAERDIARSEVRTAYAERDEARAETESARTETESTRAEREFARTETESTRAERDAARDKARAARDEARAAWAARTAAEAELAALREQLRRQQEQPES